MHRRSLLGLAALPLLAPRTGRAQRLEALFAPRARLWERWTAQDARSTLAVDHAAWDGFLRRYRRAGADGVARQGSESKLLR